MFDGSPKCYQTVGAAEELSQLRSTESHLKTQLQDVKKRENVLVLKLAAKEQEVAEYRVGGTFLASYFEDGRTDTRASAGA